MYIYVYVVSIIKINMLDETPVNAERILGRCKRNKLWWMDLRFIKMCQVFMS